MTHLYLFPELADQPWWRAAQALRRSLAGQADSPGAARAQSDPSTDLSDAVTLHAELLGQLAGAGFSDPRHAAAVGLVGTTSLLSRYAGGDVPSGLLSALTADLDTIAALVRFDFDEPLRLGSRGRTPPRLVDLAPALPEGMDEEVVASALAVLAESDAQERVAAYLRLVHAVGTGVSALYPGLRWQRQRLLGLTHPDQPDWGELHGLDEQLARLEANTAALLAGRPAHHTLLYGPRGSGKSTAVKGLLPRFRGSSLRLLELPSSELAELPQLLELLRRQPNSFVIFIDDLSFEAGEVSYRPLKSLLEGTLTSRPGNFAVYATSNRRHLLRERLGDRPDPLDDDVHGWDTHNERLALSDRFGLTITFPNLDQRRYLETVAALAALRGVADDSLDERALRFADWGNGYSGRTAKQFIDQTLQAEGGQPA